MKKKKKKNEGSANHKHFQLSLQAINNSSSCPNPHSPNSKFFSN